MKCLDAALDYNRRGLSIIPIKRGEKTPLIPWTKNQESHANEWEIRGWFDKGDINIGIVTGKISGLIVIDIDSDEAKARLEEVAGDYDLKSVPRTRTGRGWQYFFKHPGCKIHNRAGIFPGCDVRADGGYVVAAPSRHPNGNDYQWEIPMKGELPELPNQLLNLISSSVNSAGENPTPGVVGIIQEGQRNATLTSLAGYWRKWGCSEEAILCELLIVNRTQCVPRLPEQEVEKIAKSVAKYPSAPSRIPAQAKPVVVQDCLYGLPGEIVEAIEPYTESDPMAVLASLLVGFGNIIGRGPHFRVEFTKHYLKLFVCLVGKSSHGRKGQSWSTLRYIFNQIDPVWIKERVTGGLSSGEGLINHVRDQITEKQPIKAQGKDIEYQDVITDHGVTDKRLLLLEEELSQALKVMHREGNILSATLRQAWDSGDLHPLTKNKPITASASHISIIAHITKVELLRHLQDTDRSNGFANRFIWLLVGRSKLIPTPKGVPLKTLEPLIDKLREVIEFARSVDEIKRNDEAESTWVEVYPKLSGDQPGMFGAIIARAEAQVMRLACLYALLDRSSLINADHLKAALAFWDYSEDSAKDIFGEKLGDSKEDQLAEELRDKGQLTMTEISKLFGNNVSSKVIHRIVGNLVDAGIARPKETQSADGRAMTVIEHTNCTKITNSPSLNSLNSLNS